uniref:Uncharacterized protein n=1 Tax=Meloidogyne javanica TaxID=6303 RepID=A0A915LLQ8_MELJA
MLLIFTAFLYVLASFNNQGIDPYKGLVADEEQLAQEKEYRIELMKKLGIGNDSKMKKKSVKEETKGISIARIVLN